ncbi:MAG: hypothetical protein JW896_13710, partial [Deltaproteobacteria bacterium]|nr:hypothetical protein [Deltaproteobacteria bacterium]
MPLNRVDKCRQSRSYGLRWSSAVTLLPFFLICFAVTSFGQENPRGLAPVRDATYMPELGGVLNKDYHNQYGQKRDLSECIVLRGSKIK